MAIKGRLGQSADVGQNYHIIRLDCRLPRIRHGARKLTKPSIGRVPAPLSILGKTGYVSVRSHRIEPIAALALAAEPR